MQKRLGDIYFSKLDPQRLEGEASSTKSLTLV